MRLKTAKPEMQQHVATQLNAASKLSGRVFNRDLRRLVIHAGKTALAAALCWWVALRFGLRDGYWGSISAIIVLQSNVGATVTASRDRLLGTFIGALLGFGFSILPVPLLFSYILALLVAVVASGMLALSNSSRLACVTITIVMLVHREGPRWGLAFDRVAEVVMGIVVALIVTTVVLPDRARLRLRDGLAKEFLLLGTFFEAILEGFRGTTSENLQSLREEVEAIENGNDQLLDASRNEPSGAGWPEGLSMLSQFGRALFDALLALDLAVRGSHEDAYAQQLEPALGQLITDIHAGFNYAAECICRWHFAMPPEHIHLEQDIASLEARMDAVRHTGIGFSQAEILRAYAVQLHLKQIARLLRASRVETCRALGQTASNSV
jgi:uncharacterized membrane protein YccC